MIFMIHVTENVLSQREKNGAKKVKKQNIWKYIYFCNEILFGPEKFKLLRKGYGYFSVTINVLSRIIPRYNEIVFE